MNDAPVLRPNPLLHYHQCGRVRDGWLDGYGCGYLFSHRFAKNLSLVDQHKCPACQRGPWYYQLSQEEFESAKQPRHVESGIDNVDNSVR